MLKRLGERIRVDLWERPSKNFAALDGMRGFASVIVVLYHCALFTSSFAVDSEIQERWSWLIPLLNGFWSGIDIFFVLSGFLIARSLMMDMNGLGHLRYRTFLIRRFARIFPAYYLVLLLSLYLFLPMDLPIFDFLYQTSDRESLRGTSWTNFVYISNYIYPGTSPSILTWGWSLCIEEHFYLILPPLVWLMFRTLPDSRRIGFLLLCSSLPLFGRIAQYLVNPAIELMSGFYYYSHNRFDEIFVGVVIAYFYVVHRPALEAWVRGAGSMIWISGIGLVAMVWIFGGLLESNALTIIWQFILMALGSGLLLLNCLFLQNRVTRFFAHRAWYPLARISYGTYLIHPFVLFLVLQVVNQFHTLPEVGPGELIAIYLVVMALSSIVAGAMFIFYERPILSAGVRLIEQLNASDQGRGS